MYENQYLSGGGIRYSDAKRELAEVIYKELKPIQEKRIEIEKDKKYVNRMIKEGSEKARKIASETLKEVKEKMGFIENRE